METQEQYKKTEDLITKFPNGKERFRKSALFNKTIQMLIRGVDVYDVIDQLIMVNEDTAKAFEHHLNKY